MPASAAALAAHWVVGRNHLHAAKYVTESVFAERSGVPVVEGTSRATRRNVVAAAVLGSDCGVDDGATTFVQASEGAFLQGTPAELATTEGVVSVALVAHDCGVSLTDQGEDWASLVL